MTGTPAEEALKMFTLPRRGADKLWPATCVCTAWGLRMVYTFFNACEDSKEECSVAHENYVTFKFQCP